MSNGASYNTGLYLHIPFCKRACHYCNFHFSTSLKLKEPLLEALMQELTMQRDYLGTNEVDTVYFGGGTPSLLETHEFVRLFDHIYQLFKVASGAEVTLEANPDDLSVGKVADLKNHTPVNRLSIGIQSFQDAELLWMNRAHHAADAFACLERVRRAGFTDWTADLIYGIPIGSDAGWAQNVRELLAFAPPHISAYCLTVEEGTALHHFVEKGKTQATEDLVALRQYEYLMDALDVAGYEHYEISNFAQPGRHARHNSNYWLGGLYLGVGPSAHSYNGNSRQWNIANNALYVKALNEGRIPFEAEALTPVMKYNEYVMTRIRTRWGCRLEDIQKIGDAFAGHFLKESAQLLKQGFLKVSEAGVWTLTKTGKFQADRISGQLFAETQ